MQQETLESHTNGGNNNMESLIKDENSACQDQILENNFDDKMKKTVDNAVMPGESHA